MRHRSLRMACYCHLHLICHQPCWRGLTTRSSGAPTAGRQARSGGTRYIFASPGLASCRRRPLSSNVRPRRRDLPLSKMQLLGSASARHQPRLLPRGAGLQSPGWRQDALLSRIVSFSGICSAQKQPAAQFVAHAVLVPPSSHLPPTVQAWPNHSLKRSANGRPPGPVWRYALHYRHPGPGALPSSPA